MADLSLTCPLFSGIRKGKFRDFEFDILKPRIIKGITEMEKDVLPLSRFTKLY